MELVLTVLPITYHGCKVCNANVLSVSKSKIVWDIWVKVGDLGISL